MVLDSSTYSRMTSSLYSFQSTGILNDQDEVASGRVRDTEIWERNVENPLLIHLLIADWDGMASAGQVEGFKAGRQSLATSRSRTTLTCHWRTFGTHLGIG
jgi:hypothetical protein